MITKRYYIRAAAMVKGIVDGEWTHDAPSWVPRVSVYGTREHTLSGDGGPCYDGASTDADSINYTRAVQTAEAFILFFTGDNPLFDPSRFLVACGLAPKPAPKKRSK